MDTNRTHRRRAPPQKNRQNGLSWDNKPSVRKRLTRIMAVQFEQGLLASKGVLGKEYKKKTPLTRNGVF